MMEPDQDRLDPEALAAELGTTWLGRPHAHVGSCPSTNDLAAAEARRGASEGLLVTADAQTAGRGRQGRIWHSPAGTNLYFSLLLRPRATATHIPPLTLLVGGALAEAIASLGFDVRVKWPNDLLVAAGHRRRKVAGILTEASTEGARLAHVIVGIGINVNGVGFPAELADKATSLRLAGGEPLSRVAVLSRILAVLEPAYEHFAERGPAVAISTWESYADLGRRCRVVVEGREVEGVSEGVDPDGALRVRSDDGRRHRVISGEVATR